MRSKLPEKLKSVFCEDTPYIPLALILLLGIAAYANSFSVPLQFDDVITLRKNLSNPFKLGFSGGTRWVTDLTFSLNRLAGGEIVAGYHAVNLAIHLASAAMLYLFVRSSLEALKISFKLSAESDHSLFLRRFAPLATAVFFVSHPVQTQAITYIAQRYTSLATLFYLAAMLMFVRARIHCRGVRAWVWGGGAIVVALLAMMSKEIAFTLPLMLIVLEIALFRSVLLKKPLFLALGVALMLTIPLQLLQRFDLSGLADIPVFLQQATAEVQGLSRGDYFLTQMRVAVTYLRLLILPINQNLDYDYPIQRFLFAPEVIASMTLHLSFAATAVLLFVRSRKNLLSGNFVEGMAVRLGVLGIVWFYLTLSVESSIIPIRDVIYEHRLYLPSGGIFLSVSCLAAAYADSARRRTTAWWLVACCCVLLTVATVARNRVWNSHLGLWMDVLAKSPNKTRPQYLVGFFLSQRAMPDKALPHLVRAIELTDTASDVWIALNSAVCNLGVFKGRCNDGLQYHQMVFTIDPRHFVAWQAVSYNNLGLAYEYLGNLRAARVNFEKASLTNPELDLGWLNQAVNAAKLNDQGRLSAALDRLEAINPQLARLAAEQLKIRR